MKPVSSNKSLWLSLLLFLSPLFFYGQTLTGLWVGTVHNDSASVRKDQSFEIALTEKDGKVTGYSRNEFIVNDTLYYIVKKVKGSINGNKCEVTDDEVVSYNFPGKLEKGITVSSFFYLNTITNTWKLDSWKTNVPRRKYYSVGGKMDMETEADLASSKLFAHLEELNKADDVAFYKERKEEQSSPVVKIARPEKVQTEYTDKIPDNTATDMAVRKPELPVPVKVVPPVAVVTAKNEEAAKPTLNESGSSQPALAKTETAPVLTTVENPVILPTNTTADKPAGKKETAVTNETAKPVAIAAVKTESTTAPTATGSANPVTTAGGKTEQAQATTNPVKKTDNTAIAGNQNNTITKPPVGTKQVNQAPVTGATGNPVARTGSNPKPAVPQPAAVTTPAPEKETDKAATAIVPVITNKTVAANPVPETRPVVIPSGSNSLVVKNPGEDPIKKSAVIAGRKSEFTQEIQFKSDSLILTLYDNGEIDGDTVSVYLNGEVVMPSQGLKSSAIRKTIHLPHDVETFTLVMFAESLGKYPPNTGLLVIRDGNDVYNLRFSSDFSKSSGIVFRKKG